MARVCLREISVLISSYTVNIIKKVKVNALMFKYRVGVMAHTLSVLSAMLLTRDPKCVLVLSVFMPFGSRLGVNVLRSFLLNCVFSLTLQLPV